MTVATFAPVFDSLVGQDEVVTTLSAAVESAAAVVAHDGAPTGAMTHAWLFTRGTGGRTGALKAQWSFGSVSGFSSAGRCYSLQSFLPLVRR